MMKISLADRTGKTVEDWNVRAATIFTTFARVYPGMSAEELLIRPRESLNLCNEVRRINPGGYDCPDDMILRTLCRTTG